ncbi:Uncharacterised protein [Enterobacter cancerogenus]|uniref:Uncharacterized protein n=1 Tax=Enterobacter cancerogenus TaxID=69218 RepID=A0A484XH01_9ENTR|nr:Uncharacterised protein [Enterobacter cancerogenus]
MNQAHAWSVPNFFVCSMTAALMMYYSLKMSNRLSRLKGDEWEKLKAIIRQRGVWVVAVNCSDLRL